MQKQTKMITFVENFLDTEHGKVNIRYWTAGFQKPPILYYLRSGASKTGESNKRLFFNAHIGVFPILV